MLSASQFRTAVEQYAPQNVGQLGNANTNWFKVVDRPAYRPGTQPRRSRAPARAWTTACRPAISTKTASSRAPTLSVSLWGSTTISGSSSDDLSLRAHLRGSRTADEFTPGGVLSNAAQMGPTQPVLDASQPGRVLRLARRPAPGAGQPVGHSGAGLGTGHHVSEHREHSGRVHRAVPRGPAGQLEPRLRRDQGRARELHPEHPA